MTLMLMPHSLPASQASVRVSIQGLLWLKLIPRSQPEKAFSAAK